MAKDGINWKISKERRDLEREEKERRYERLNKAANRKKETLEKIDIKEKQLKITAELQKLPENRRKILEMEIERERLMMLKEAKEELWKKENQKKGRGYMKKPKKEEEKISLERKLERIEEEVRKLEEELEKEMVEVLKNTEIREERLEKRSCTLFDIQAEVEVTP